MSAAYKRGTAAALANTGPCQLVAVQATLGTGAGSVSVYDGVDAGGEPVLTLAVNGSSAAFCPSVPIALHRGLYVAVTNSCEYTVVWV
ncbi:MAG: hypothetical protein QME94_08510 [Anaerolineae bacterium]|nr:hypothetical protein [Anaerolineae bacterium]